MNDDNDSRPAAADFVPVCAIGASAGGVSALQSLFRQLPTDLGLAYVVILHLSPDQPSALSDILAACTRMPVRQVEDTPTLTRDCVYVIPPDRELVIEGDSVAARPFSEPRGHRAPIDLFFRSVAAGRGDGVAIVLSGAGSDGALGVAAFKEAGGVIMVQDPAEAAFASMPQNAIASGFADFVAPIARLAERLVELAHSKEAVRSLDLSGSGNELRRIVALLRSRTGHDFSSYKRATVMRRVLRRMQVCRTDTLADYGDYLLTTPEEAQNLFSDLLISVTMFFRDEHAFQALARRAIAPLFDMVAADAEEVLRVWVVGCATGEEAYSLAILLHEALRLHDRKSLFQIFATDLDEGSLAIAREGRYPRAIEADVSEERLSRFFIDEGTHYRVRKELRESILFAKHSVLKDPPFMRLDLVTCRNLLIYLERALQAQVCSIFHYGLKPGRFLFLGSAETVDAAVDLFTPIDRQARIYCAKPNAGHLLPILPQFAAPDQFAFSDRSGVTAGERVALPAALHVAALEHGAPPSVLVDHAQQILHLSPSAGRFILHSAGPVSTSLPTVVRPELRLDLRLALARALDQREPTVTFPIAVSFERERRNISMQVSPVVDDAQEVAQALVLFLDGGPVVDGIGPEAAPDARTDEVRRLYAELKASQEALIISRTGHDASIQELRAANEELQSINEEYRSTAEELETSKEELQSINEELHTVNAELKSKLETISAAHSDLQNLTSATEIGTLFLDRDLRIRMFTPSVANLFNITRHDVGRAVTDFTHQLDYDGIEQDARLVLERLAPVEKEVRSRGGQAFFLRVRPYRTVEDRIDGVVVTFVDVTERAKTEAALRESEIRYRTIFDAIDEGFVELDVVLSPDGKAVDWRYLALNPSFERQTGLKDITGKLISEVLPNLEPEWAERYTRVVSTGEPMRFEAPSSDLDRWFDVYVARIGGAGSRRLAVVYNDVTERRRAEAALRASGDRQSFLLAFGDAVRAETSAEQVIVVGARMLGEKLSASRVVFAEIDEVGGLAHFREGWVATGSQNPPPSVRLTDFGGPLLDDARGGRPIRVDDVGPPPHARPDLAALAAIGVRACLSVPLIAAGRLVANINVHQHAPRHWTDADVALVETIAERIWAEVGRARAETALRDSEARQRVLVEGMPQLVWRGVDGGEWTWASPRWGEFTGQADVESHGFGWLEAVHPDDRDRVVKLWQAAIGRPEFNAEYRIRHRQEGRYRWFQSRAAPVRDHRGLVTEWLGASTDIDDLRSLQARQQVLVTELQHRTFNLLGVVRSTAEATVRSSGTLEEFKLKFRDRIDSLARVQRLLSRLKDDDRVTLDALIRTELNAAGAFSPDDGRVTLEGPADVILRSGAVQIFAMAIHELTTNALKYGALKQPAARLRVGWRVEAGGDEEPWLHLDWEESGVVMPKPGAAASDAGQGRSLIEDALPYQLNASTTYALTADGVRCSIALPMTRQIDELGAGLDV